MNFYSPMSGLGLAGNPLSGIGMMNSLMNASHDAAPAPTGAKPTGLVDGEKAPGGGKGKEALQGALKGLMKGMGEDKRTDIPQLDHLMAEIMPSSSSQFLEQLFARSMR